MTWVEIVMTLCVIGMIGGWHRRTRGGRGVMAVSGGVFVLLLLLYGREFVADLF